MISISCIWTTTSRWSLSSRAPPTSAPRRLSKLFSSVVAQCLLWTVPMIITITLHPTSPTAMALRSTWLCLLLLMILINLPWMTAMVAKIAMIYEMCRLDVTVQHRHHPHLQRLISNNPISVLEPPPVMMMRRRRTTLTRNMIMAAATNDEKTIKVTSHLNLPRLTTAKNPLPSAQGV